MRVTLFILAVIVLGCKNGNRNGGSSDTAILTHNSSNTTPVNTDFTKDTVFTLHFPKDSSSITVVGKLNGINKPVTVIVPIKKGSLLTAALVVEDSIANIRFNQIFFPDGKADGPFGRTLIQKIKAQGDYRLIIGENLMQGEEWRGKFKLTVKVE